MDESLLDFGLGKNIGIEDQAGRGSAAINSKSGIRRIYLSVPDTS